MECIQKDVFINEIKPVYVNIFRKSKAGDCYHYHCRWQSKCRNSNIARTIDTIDIDLYPLYDYIPLPNC